MRLGVGTSEPVEIKKKMARVPEELHAVYESYKLKDDDHPYGTRVWHVDDIKYSAVEDKWYVCMWYYNDAIDEGSYKADLEEFLSDFEPILN